MGYQLLIFTICQFDPPLSFSQLSPPTASAITTPPAIKRHSPKDLVIVRKARLESDDAPNSRQAATPAASRQKQIARPNPIKPTTLNSEQQPIQPGDEKIKTPPKCEISLMGRSAFVPVKKPVKSLDQIQRELAAHLESPSPTESAITEPATKASEKSVTNQQSTTLNLEQQPMKEVQPGDEKIKTPPKCEISLMLEILK